MEWFDLVNKDYVLTKYNNKIIVSFVGNNIFKNVVLVEKIVYNTTEDNEFDVNDGSNHIKKIYGKNLDIIDRIHISEEIRRSFSKSYANKFIFNDV